MKGPIKDHSYICPNCKRILIDHSDWENDAEYLTCRGLNSCGGVEYKKSELKKYEYKEK